MLNTILKMLNKSQIRHYYMGGFFKAKYSPLIVKDLSSENLAHIGESLIFYQNIDVSPIQEETYFNNYRLNSNTIHGWVPSCDLSDIEELSLREKNQSLKTYRSDVHMYRLTYTNQDQIDKNFGKGFDKAILPFYVYRSYDKWNHHYVKESLSDPKATAIDYYFHNPLKTGKFFPDWERIEERKDVLAEDKIVLPNVPIYVQEYLENHPQYEQ